MRLLPCEVRDSDLGSRISNLLERQQCALGFGDTISQTFGWEEGERAREAPVLLHKVRELVDKYIPSQQFCRRNQCSGCILNSLCIGPNVKHFHDSIFVKSDGAVVTFNTASYLSCLSFAKTGALRAAFPSIAALPRSVSVLAQRKSTVLWQYGDSKTCRSTSRTAMQSEAAQVFSR